MKLKTCVLKGEALDWAVAKCEGIKVQMYHQYLQETATQNNYPQEKMEWLFSIHKNVVVMVDGVANPHLRHTLTMYSTDWAYGGPIIEREIKTLERDGDGWFARTQQGFTALGATPLEAAMRCYVASKLGNEIDIPKELL